MAAVQNVVRCKENRGSSASACTRLLKSGAVGAEEREEMKAARMCGDALHPAPKSSLITVEGEAVITQAGGGAKTWRRPTAS